MSTPDDIKEFVRLVALDAAIEAYTGVAITPPYENENEKMFPIYQQGLALLSQVQSDLKPVAPKVKEIYFGTLNPTKLFENTLYINVKSSTSELKAIIASL